MRWLLALVVMLGAGVAEAKQAPPPTVAVKASLSAKIGAKAPVLKVVVTNPMASPVQLAAVEHPPCWIGLYFTGSLMKPDLTELATVKPCQDPGTKTFELAPKESLTVEVAVDKLFERLPQGTYELALQFDSGQATTRDRQLAVGTDTPLTSALRFTIAKLVKTITVTTKKPASLGKGVTLTFVGNGHKHMPAGSGPSPLLVSAKLTLRGKTRAVDASVNGKEPFSLGAHVFSIVDYSYDDFMTLDYWGTIALSP